MTTLETVVQQTTCTRPSVFFLKYGGGVYDGCTIVDLAPLHMSPVDLAGPDAGTISPCIHIRNFSPVSEMKKAKNPGDYFWREVGETKQT